MLNQTNPTFNVKNYKLLLILSGEFTYFVEAPKIVLEIIVALKLL